ncbi:MAG: class IV adenylate cyclase [Candidatus Promineifilaceae bacterium]
MAAAGLEVEVKFYAADLPAVRGRLVAAGASLIRPRVFERNVRYDNAWSGLARRGRLLRLRQDTAASLTFKALPDGAPASEARVRQELEVGVGDFGVMEAILERLGFQPSQCYEKYREAWQLGPVEVVLDELPFGDFVELEGPEERLRAAAEALDLDWGRRILENYLGLMARLKAHHKLPFDDLTFANFAGLEVRIADVLG